MHKTIQRLLILVFGLTLGLRTLAFGAACSATADGNWSSGLVWTGCTGPGGIPAPGDTISITTGTNVILDVNATVAGLNLSVCSTNCDLTHSGNAALTVNGNVNFYQPTTNGDANAWNIHAGSATVTGAILFNGVSANNRVSSITITTGELNARGGMTFQGTTATNKIILMSGGAGTLNMAGTLSFAGNAMTLTAGTAGSIFNYVDTNAQSLRAFPVGAYHNLHINNTNASGASLTGVFTSTNVTGNVRVQTGTLKNGGFALSSLGDILDVANGAIFEMSGVSAFPTGFSSYAFGATSRVRYLQTSAAVTISSQPFGHLDLMPAGTATHTFPAGAVTINGNLSLGDGTNITTIAAQTNNTSLVIGGSLTINPNTTFTAHTTNPLRVAGDWTNTGTFTHNNSTVAFTGSSAQFVRNRGQAFSHVISSNSSSGGLTFTSSFTAARLYVNSGDLNSSATVYFAGAASFTISTFSANGTSAWPVVLRSTTSSTAWLLNNTSSHTVSYVDVKDSNASSGRRILDYPGGTDSTGNTNWVIAFNPPINITVSTAGQTSLTAVWTPAPSGDNYTFQIATSSDFGGTLTSSNTTSTTAALGSLSINTTYYLRANTTLYGVTSIWSTATVAAATLVNTPSAAGATWSQVNVSSLTMNWSNNSNPTSVTTYVAEISSMSGFDIGTLVSSTTKNLSATLANLMPGTTYYGRVRAVNHQGILSNDLTLGSTVTLVIPVPSNFAYSTATTASLTAQWQTAPFVADSHTLQISTASNFTGTVTSSNTALLTATISGLAVNTTYYGRVNAVYLGSSSTWSAPLSTATLANDPTAAASPWSAVFFTSTTFNWSANGNPTPATQYTAQISSVANFLSGDIVSSVTANTSAVFSQLDSGNTYYARVRAVNHSGTPSNYLTSASTKTQASAIPSNLFFSTAQPTTLTATWSSGTVAGNTYTLEVATNSDFTGSITSSNTVFLTATVINLNINTTYYGRVNAIVSGTPSPYSAFETTATLVNDPTTVSSTWSAVNITSVTVQWSANNNPSGVTLYIVETSSVSNFGSGTTRSSTTYNTAATLDQLRAQTTYYARVKAINHSGLLSNYYVLGSTLTKNPFAPTGLLVNNVQITSTTVDWTASSPAGDSYTVQMSSMANYAAGTILSSNTANLSGTVIGLIPNTTYFARVQTILHVSSSLFTNSLTTATLASVPATAVSTWSAVQLSSLTMSWLANQNPATVTRYRAEVSAASDFSDVIISSEVLTTQATLNGLDTSTVYYGRVLAINHGGTETAYQLLGSTQTRAATSCNAKANGNWSAANTWLGCTGVGGLPAPTDSVIINATVTVTVDMNATVAGIHFATSTTANNGITHSGTSTLTVDGNVTFWQPTTTGRVSEWAINTTTAVVSGLISFNGVNANSRISRLTITSGQLDALGGMTFQGTTATNKVILMSGGAGTLNMAGSLNFAGNAMTLTAGTAGSIFNYVDTNAQSLRAFPVGAYHNLHINNTNASGATLAGVFTSTNVTGNVRVQTGTLKNGGFALSSLGDILDVANGAIFEMSGVSAFPTGFSSYAFGATSRVRYLQTSAAVTISSQPFGHLDLMPAGTATHTFPAGAVTINGNLSLGDGTNITTIAAQTNNTSLVVSGNIFINNNASLTANAANATTVGGNWSNTGTFTANNSTVAFNSGTIQTLSGSTTFYGLRAVTPNTTLKFTAATTHYVTGLVDFENVTLRSTTNDASWHFKVTGSSQTLLAVDVKDSNASSGNLLLPNLASINSGNNQNWNFSGPSAITNLSANTLSTGTIVLTWTAPTDSETNPFTGTYAIQYSTYIGAQLSTANAQVVFSTSNVTGGTAQGRTLTDLVSNTTHYIYIWAADSRPNWSALSNGATAMTLVHLPISPTFSNVYVTSVTVSWTPAPGKAARYLLEASTSATLSPVFSSSSTTDFNASSLTVSSLYSLATYYFRIGSYDWNNISTFTVVGSTKTGGSLLSVNVNLSAYNFGLVPQGSTNVATSSITITNSGNAPQKYRLHLTNPVGWTAVSTIPGVNEYRFSAAFSAAAPLYTNFDAADVVTSSDQTAADNAFAISAESQNVKGYDVPVDADRGLWFKFDAPTESSVVPAQTINITISAEAQ